MDLLENVYNKIIDKSSILNLVDEYTLYCFYLNAVVEINQVILSPIRTTKVDNLPSFRVFYGRNGVLRWYDHGIGGKGGDVFDLVKMMYNLSNFQDAINKINQDFELGWEGKYKVEGTPLETLKPIVKDPAQIDAICHDKLTPAALEYWKKYNVTPELLEEYCIKQVKYVVIDDFLKAAEPLCFSYRIGRFMKIYQPFSTEHKFINNYPSTYVEGLYQLMKNPNRKNKLLIITKSTKDVLVLRSLGIEAIAPKAENNPIPQFILDTLEAEYEDIVTLFDPDAAGDMARTRYNYPGLCLTYEEETKVKDIADYMFVYGPEKTKAELNRLLTTADAKYNYFLDMLNS
jgi:hypothetical protein